MIEKKKEKVKKFIKENGAISIAIVFMSILVIVIWTIVPIEVAKAEVPVNSFKIEFGRIVNIVDTTANYSIRLLTYDDSSEVNNIKYTVVNKIDDIYTINGEVGQVINLKQLIMNSLIVDISGDINSLYEFSKVATIIQGTGYNRYRPKVVNPPLKTTQITGKLVVVNEGSASYMESMTIQTTQSYLPNYKAVAVIGNTSANLNRFLSQGNTIVEYNFQSNIYQQGYDDGYAKATNTVNKASASYVQGLNDGNANDYSFFSLMTSVINAPLQAFNGMFNVEILGTNIRSFLLALFTIGLVIFIVRHLVGG